MTAAAHHHGFRATPQRRALAAEPVRELGGDGHIASDKSHRLQCRPAMRAMNPSYPSPFETPGAALRHHAARCPDAEALCFPLARARLSFAGWLDRAKSLARGLLDLGLEPGQHVVLLAENRLEWPVTRDISSLEELARIGAACGLGGAGPQIFAR